MNGYTGTDKYDAGDVARRARPTMANPTPTREHDVPGGEDDHGYTGPGIGPGTTATARRAK
jgi:hypothetical protein